MKLIYFKSYKEFKDFLDTIVPVNLKTQQSVYNCLINPKQYPCILRYHIKKYNEYPFGDLVGEFFYKEKEI